MSYATCVNVLDTTDKSKTSLKIDYCDRFIETRLTNNNAFVKTFYIKMIKGIDLKRIIKAYEKTLAWYDKAQKNHIKIKKEILVKEDREKKLYVKFNSNEKITVSLRGMINKKSTCLFWLI